NHAYRPRQLAEEDKTSILSFPDRHRTPSVLAIGDKPRGGAQHIAPGAEDRQRGIVAAQEIADALFGALDPQLGDEGGLAERCILPGLLAERRRVALDVEQVVGDLEGFAKRPAVIVQRLIFLPRSEERRVGKERML